MTTKTQTKAAAKPARKNAKAPAKPIVNADCITSVVPARTGNGTVVTASGKDKSLVIQPWQDNAATRRLAVVGASYAALRDHVAALVKPEARLARGVDTHNAPHSAKSVADQRKAAGKAKPAAPAKERTAKAGKNKQPSRGTVRKYKLAGRKDESKPGTFRTYMLSTIMAHKDTDSAKAAHAKSKQYPTHKLDFNWAAQQGYIAFTN